MSHPFKKILNCPPRNPQGSRLHEQYCSCPPRLTPPSTLYQHQHQCHKYRQLASRSKILLYGTRHPYESDILHMIPTMASMSTKPTSIPSASSSTGIHNNNNNNNTNNGNGNGNGGGGGVGRVADQIKRQTEQLKKIEEQQSRHKGIIRGVLEKTARLRKESKARRHRVST
jgi:hypothetical protein